MQKPTYFVLVLVTAMLVVGFWANSAPTPIRHAEATSAGISIGDMHRTIDMQSLTIQVPDAI
jgi:hypothetical protein